MHLCRYVRMRIVALISCAAVVWVGRGRASEIESVHPLDYRTSIAIGSSGVEGPDAVRFGGIDGGTLYDRASTTGGFNPFSSGPKDLFNFRLATVWVEPLATGERTTYDATPFTLTLSIDGAAPVVLNGRIDGTVSGPDDYNVTFALDTSNFQEIPNLVVPLMSGKAFAKGMPVVAGDLTSLLIDPTEWSQVSPEYSLGRWTELGASILPVPEPTPLAVFGLAIVVAAIGRRGRRGVA